jgi:hypothetical protein
MRITNFIKTATLIDPFLSSSRPSLSPQPAGSSAAGQVKFDALAGPKKTDFFEIVSLLPQM